MMLDAALYLFFDTYLTENLFWSQNCFIIGFLKNGALQNMIVVDFHFHIMQIFSFLERFIKLQGVTIYIHIDSSFYLYFAL